MKQKPVLLMNQNYWPLGQIDWRKAMDLAIFRGKAEVIESYNDGTLSVIRLTVKTPDPHKYRIADSRYRKSKVFRRDNCNCVTCCKKCNNWKGASTPEEAGMRMLYGKASIKLNDSVYITDPPEEWAQYLKVLL